VVVETPSEAASGTGLQGVPCGRLRAGFRCAQNDGRRGLQGLFRVSLDSQFKNLVIVTVGMDAVVDLSEKLRSVAGEEVHATDGPLLQAFVGI
jgi:hypothetical protein